MKKLFVSYLALLLLLLSTLLSTGCHRNTQLSKKVRGMSMYGQQEFWYTHISNSPHTAKPQVGDQVRIDYTLRKADKILSESYSSKRPVLVQIPQPMYHNFFTKALRLMGEGDSLIVLIQPEKAQELLGDFAAAFGKDDLVTFTYKMHKIKSASEFEQDLRKEIIRIDSLKATNKKWAELYSDNQLAPIIQSSNSGLQYLIHEQGEGLKAELGKLVQVHYVCYLLDGTELQDSYRNMMPLEFKLGDNSVIDGWAEGVGLLNEGGTATLFIPPHLGYGEKGVAGIIPSNATLVFYVELLSVE